MSATKLRKLADPQLQTFADNDYVTSELFEAISLAITRDFGTGMFSFIDIGGGRGLFADRLLERFPQARGVVLDNSELLLAMNRSDARKELVLASATAMSGMFVERRFDVAFFNLSLHHFVGDNYAASRTLQHDALQQAIQILSSGGRIAVTENLFEGIAVHNFPGRLVYGLTSSKALAPVIRKIGANTAGCGVCFLSARAWRDEFGTLSLKELQFHAQLWRESELKRRICLRLLTVKSVSRAFFWLAPS